MSFARLFLSLARMSARRTAAASASFSSSSANATGVISPPPTIGMSSLFLSSASSSSLSLATPINGKIGLLKRVWEKYVNLASAISPSRLGSMHNMFRQGCYLSGKKILSGSILGFPMLTGMIANESMIAHAMDEYDANGGEPSGYLKDEINAFWALARKFQLITVLLIMVLLGWRRPITLAVNIALLLFCTRPNPFSIYMFVEQLRQRDMNREFGLYKSKFLYTKKVEVEDYKFLCLANVELRDAKLHIVGILGGWWVYHTSKY